MASAIQALIGYYGLSCPVGGSAYICPEFTTEFVGCCTVNPCTKERDGVCPDDKLRAATFSSERWGEIKAQSCSVVPTEAKWWTCTGTKPPFLGCCTVNPCANSGCSAENLRPAVLNNIAGQEWNRDHFLNPTGSGISYNSSKTEPSSSSSSTSEPTSSSTSEPTSSSTNQPTSSTNDGGLSTGAIAGIAVGAVIAVLIIVAGILWKCGWFPRKKKAEENKQEGDVPGATMSPMTPMAQQAYPHQGQQGYGYADESGRSVMSSPSTGYVRDSYVSGLTAPGSQYGPLSPALSKAGLHSQHASPNLKQEGFDQKYGYNGYNGYQNNGLGLGTVSELPVTDHHHGAQELPAGNNPGFEMDAGAVQPPQEQNQPQQHVGHQEGNRQDASQEQVTQHGEERMN